MARDGLSMGWRINQPRGKEERTQILQKNVLCLKKNKQGNKMATGAAPGLSRDQA
jgi:hypothetical protein